MTTQTPPVDETGQARRDAKSLPKIVEATDPLPAETEATPSLQRTAERLRDMWEAGNKGAPAGAPADKWLIMLGLGVSLFALLAYLGVF